MQEMSVLLEIVQEAGRLIPERRLEPSSVASKGSIDFVTDVDKAVERFICGKLRETYPEDDILSEEGAVGRRRGDRRWILDPVDGTTNLIRGYPFIAISVALEIGRELVLGIVYNPVMHELYAAEKGKGATLGGAPIAAGGTAELARAVLASGFPYDMWDTENDNTDLWRAFLKSCVSCRCDGSAALDLCRVACGQFDGYWESGLAPWDMAAGMLIAGEAGCLVTDYDGRGGCLERGEIVAANPAIHSQMLRKIQGK